MLHRSPEEDSSRGLPNTSPRCAQGRTQGSWKSTGKPRFPSPQGKSKFKHGLKVTTRQPWVQRTPTEPCPELHCLSFASGPGWIFTPAVAMCSAFCFCLGVVYILRGTNGLQETPMQRGDKQCHGGQQDRANVRTSLRIPTLGDIYSLTEAQSTQCKMTMKRIKAPPETPAPLQ